MKLKSILIIKNSISLRSRLTKFSTPANGLFFGLTFGLIAVSQLPTKVLAADESILPDIIVSETNESASADISGFPGAPLRTRPLSVKLIDSQQLQANQVHRLSDVTRLDASTTDSYNATGYWDIMAIRGFSLDNRQSYFREGLPISAETSIPLDNKESIEILKGLGGLASGSVAPGGLINYVVKRPTDTRLRQARVELGEKGDALVAADMGGRFESSPQFGYRVNLAQEQIEPNIDHASGSRSLLSAAADWRISRATLLETELEWSKRSQLSRAGYSLFGSDLPTPPSNPRINLNDQAWALPVVFEALTATLRLKQQLVGNWNLSLALGSQNLRTDDRLAYPYGCTDENVSDRYCSNGNFDVYDYRSENELRDRQAAKLALQGRWLLGETRHDLNFGASASQTREHFNNQAYNFVGTGNVSGGINLPADPGTRTLGTNRQAHNLDFFAFDNIGWNSWNLWLGARSTALHRESQRTDGSRATELSQNFILPWQALSYEVTPFLVYLSHSQGTESFVVPNRTNYTNPGQTLPDVLSQQWELGVRNVAAASAPFTWGLSFFEIQRPLVVDLAPRYQVDGKARHRGVELELTREIERWHWEASAMLLRAEGIQSDLSPELNGLRPVNVPSHTLRFGGNYLLGGVGQWRLNSRIVQEGPRAVTADNSVIAPTWTRWDAGISSVQKIDGWPVLMTLAVENLSDQRYWRETPIQYGHVYLYPGEARSYLLSLQAAF